MNKSSKASHGGSIHKAFLEQTAEQLPPPWDGYLRKCIPILRRIGQACEPLRPYFKQLHIHLTRTWEFMQASDASRYLQLILGFMLCFFGTSFDAVIIAVEAVRLSTWQGITQNLRILYQNYQDVCEANKLDNLVDDDDNGIADVEEISAEELLNRKLYLFMHSIDPEQIMMAFTALWMSFLAVVATVKGRFAHVITLSWAVGGVAFELVGPKLVPIVHAILPKDMRKWAQRLPRIIITGWFFALGLFFSHYFIAIYSGIRGGQLLAIYVVRELKQRGKVAQDVEEDGQLVQACGFGLAAIGTYWQFSNNFGVPFPLNLLLLPALAAEWVLEISATSGLV